MTYVAPSEDATPTRARTAVVDTLVRCEHAGCPFPATKQMRIEQRAGTVALRFCMAHAGVWVQRCVTKRGQTMTISDYPCPESAS